MDPSGYYPPPPGATVNQSVPAAPAARKPVLGWLATGVLVLVGVTLGGMAVAFFVPEKHTTTVATNDEKSSVAADAVQQQPKAVAAPSPQPEKTAKTGTPQQPPGSQSPATPAPPPAPDPWSVAAAPDVPAKTVATTPQTGPAVRPQSPATPPAAKPSAEPSAAEKPGQEDAQKRAAYARAVGDARSAMANRNLPNARRHLKTAGANIQSEADRAELDRLQIMLDNLVEFWTGVRGAVARLQPTEELELRDNRVAVIAASKDELIVQMYGRPHRWPIDSIPVSILGAIVRQSFAQTPGSKVVVGTFLAIDVEGMDRAEARKLWQEAAKGGQDLAKTLLPELDVPPPAGTGAQGAAPAAKAKPRRR